VLFFLHVGRDYLAAIPRHQFFANVFDIPMFRAAQHLGTWEGFRKRGEVTQELKRRFYYPKGIDIRSTRTSARASRKAS
jgi:hypothetical protein